jgi:uncharacterized Zn-binding protein involved in type VI secretion
MRKIALALAILAAILLPAQYSAPAYAQNNHSWVSHSGNDGNSCVAASPCQTFSRALAQTQDGGELSCYDSGSFFEFTVTISVTIDCNGTVAAPDGDPILCGTGIAINALGKVVTLRGLNVTGFLCNTNGIVIQAATAVYIEDCVIENWPHQGIVDNRTTGGTKLAIKNTIVRNNGSAGIVVAATFRNSAVLENVQSVGNTYGIAVATDSNVVINRSVMSENSAAGIEADSGAFVYVDNTAISQNANYGIYAAGTVGLANSDITFNVSSIFGTTMSYGNNRLFQNGSGTAPTPVGGTSTDFGQQ